MKKYIYLIPLLWLAACGGRTEKTWEEPSFFAGEFIFTGDEAFLTDCATAARLPVSVDEAYLQAEHEYLLLEADPGEAVFLEFRGHLADQPVVEGRIQRTVVIDSLIGFSRDRECGLQWLLAGVYESDTEGVSRILRLHPDYSFTESVQEPDSAAETKITGRWYRSAELEMVLAGDAPRTEPVSFQIIPVQESLSRNSGDSPLVYKKVYL